MITVAPIFNVEIAKDGLVTLLLGPEYAAALDEEYARQPVKIELRYPAYGYIDEVKTLDGYPAFEIVNGSSAHSEESEEFLREFSIQWTVNGDNEQNMAREVMRLVAATHRFVDKMQGSLLPYAGGKFWTERDDTGPTSEGRKDPFVKSASVRLMWRAYGI
jgi:hypothetical protein